jgi:hypothetical protein
MNNKHYIGMHKTLDLNDGYMGSGKLIRAAIKKHGSDSFSKEIIHIFDNEKDMRNKEKELVVLSEMSYNLCDGGKGGWGYINHHKLWLTDKHLEAANRNRVLGAAKFSKMMNEDTEFRMKQGLKIKENHPSNKVGYVNPFLGKNHSEEFKDKMRGHQRQSGEKNSQFGKPRSEETKRKIRESLLKKNS